MRCPILLFASVASIASCGDDVNRPVAISPDLTVVLVDTTANILLSGKGGSGDLTVAVQPVDIPEHGQVLPKEGPAPLNVTYRPFTGYIGDDAFRFSVQDEEGEESLKAVVEVRVVPPNGIPENPQGQLLSTPQDTPLLITLVGSDPDGDDLSFPIVDPPDHGSLSDLSSTGPDRAQVTYTPAPGHRGPDSFIYEVSDGQATSELNATVVIQVTP